MEHTQNRDSKNSEICCQFISW